MAALLKMENIVKTFPGVLANNSITLEIEEGEIHCLLGENGAGKSTLMNILYGLFGFDSGRIILREREMNFRSPLDAIKEGIGMVHQHFMLVPVFTVTENLILGAEPLKGAFLDQRKAQEEILELSQKYGLNVDPEAYVQDISVGMQQRVEILKLLYRGADLLIFDEPTAILTPQEVEELYKIMRFLKSQGKTLIFITHKLREVMEISDRVTVLRDGKVVETVNTKDTSPKELAKSMVGREVLFRVKKRETEKGKVVLKVNNLHAKNQRGLPALQGISFEAREGEVVGIAGIDGNGQTELVEVLTGLRAFDQGEIVLGDRKITKKCARSCLDAGVAHIPEDRLLRGLILEFPLYENMLLGYQDKKPFAQGILLDFNKAKAWAKGLLSKYDIRAPGIETNAETLSGGNQQKVVIAREFQRDPILLVAAQPTRGLDIGATEFVHNQIMDIKSRGKAVILVSLELGEVMNLSDRILVLYEGKIQGEFDPGTVTESELGLVMAGGHLQHEKG